LKIWFGQEFLRQPRPEQLSALDLVEGLQLGHAVATLHELKILALLEKPSSAEAVANKVGLDPQLLGGALEYVAARTNLLRKIGARFVATRNYSSGSRFLLDLYGGAYRGNAVRLDKLIEKPSLAPSAVDRVRHARAFQRVGRQALGALPGIIRQLQFNHVLDIGCGPASLLLQLAEDDPQFIGWGLETNPAMYKAARAAVHDAGVGKRIRVLQGDSTDLRAALPADVRSRVQTVTACQVANEMFGGGPPRAATWLHGIREALPGRPFLISDYYGRLGRRTAGHLRETLLHDYAQLISGQGVPPASLAEWRLIYADAGCQLVHVIEDRRTTKFIHILLL
jgi:SAM-dependent methyltransferase